MIIGIGVDLVEVARIKEMLKHHGRRFIKRVYTEAEAGYSREMKRAEEHYAARFAAKEAALKALEEAEAKAGQRRQMAPAAPPEAAPLEVPEGRTGEPNK
jgi:phosphopantetheine--protein transferase-like protein